MDEAISKADTFIEALGWIRFLEVRQQRSRSEVAC